MPLVDACGCACHQKPQYLEHRKPCCLWPPPGGEAFSDLVKRSSTSVLVSDVMPLLEAVQEWSEAKEIARLAFIDAVLSAAEAGVTNSSIALHAGITEAGVRQILKRNPRLPA